jgi:hypothetical protein
MAKAAWTIKVKFRVTVVWAASRSVIVIEKEPADVGVPMIRPVVEPIDNPGGSPDAVQTYGGSPPAPSIVNT